MSVSDATLPDVHDDEVPNRSIDSLARADGDLRVDSNVKSPYADSEIVSLDAGPTKTRYRVHRAILAQSSELDAKSTQDVWGEKTISLPELDETAVHTLVHFLYTGRYHALESRDLEGRSAISQYKLSTCAYCAAIRYKLPGLAELAKQTMVSLQEGLTILDVLVVAREHAFPLLPEDETWFSEHLESAIHAAVAKDAGLFTTAGFVDQIEGDRRYRQVVMKAIVNTLSRGSAAASVTDSEKDHRTSTLSPVVAIANYDGDITAMTTPETLMDEITPTLDTHVAPEPYTDELGWGSSTTYRNQKMSNQGVANVPVPSKPGHARVDSPIEDEAPAPVPLATSEVTVPAPAATTEATAPAPAATTKATAPAPAPTATTKATAPAPAATTKATVPTPIATTEPTVPTPAAPAELASDTAASPIVKGADTNSAVAKKNKKKKKKTAATAAIDGIVNPVAPSPAPVVAN